MESPNPKFALYGRLNECARTNMLLLLLSEISTGAVSLIRSVDFLKSKSFAHSKCSD